MVYRSLIVSILLLAGVASAQVAQRPGTTRMVTSLMTDTARSSDYFGWIAWLNPAPGTKTQTMPVCNAGNNGSPISVVDEEGNAGQYAINIVPTAGGLVAGTVAGTSISTNKGALTLVCNGAGNWNVTAQVASGPSVREAVGLTDTILSSDNGGLVTYREAGKVTVTLPEAGTPAFPANGFSYAMRNYGDELVEIEPVPPAKIGGGSKVDIPAKAGAFVFANRLGDYDIIITGIGSGGTTPPIPGGPASVWSTTDKEADITLSQTNEPDDTATVPTTGTGYKAVRGTQAYSVGTNQKRIFTLHVLTAGPTQPAWIGGVSDTGPLLTEHIGAFPNSFGVMAQGPSGTGAAGYYHNGPTWYQQANTCAVGTAAGFPNFYQGRTMWLAVNFNSGHIWCSTDCIEWRGNGLPVNFSDPDADTYPQVTLTPGTYFPAWSASPQFSPGAAAVIDTKPSLTGCSNVSTYSTWD